MKTFTLFILFIYWSLIIFAPVVSKENKIFQDKMIIPLEKPNK